MPNTQNLLRQPVFKGLRDDVLPEEAGQKAEVMPLDMVRSQRSDGSFLDRGKLLSGLEKVN